MQLAAAVVIALLIAVGTAALAAPDLPDASLSLPRRKAVPLNAGPETGRARAWRAAASLRRNVRQLFPAASRDSREVRS
jgi:hypothetical protein